MKALSARFRKPRLVIVGCGDIGLRTARLLSSKYRIIALSSQASRKDELHAAGLRVMVADLDQRASMPALMRLASLAPHMLHLAPPQSSGMTDWRTLRLIQTLRGTKLQSMVYVSTTGVYGDHAGAQIDETTALKPQTERAHRRVDAERQLRALGAQGAARVTILRVPGIYDTTSRSPRERLLKGTPALRDEDDVYTNHIHADDLARICMAALMRGKPQRIINANDDSQMKMGEYFDLAADAMLLPRPPRISRAQALAQLSPMQMSFLQESRRLQNKRLHNELRIKLHWPHVQDCFAFSSTAENSK